MAEDRTATPVIALSPTEARFVTKPPLGAKTIKHALQSGELVAHRLGVNAFITVPDLIEWISSKEDYRHARQLHSGTD